MSARPDLQIAHTYFPQGLDAMVHERAPDSLPLGSQVRIYANACMGKSTAAPLAVVLPAV